MIDSEEEFKRRLTILYEDIDKIDENRNFNLLDDGETDKKIKELTDAFAKEAFLYFKLKEEKESKENK